MNYGDYSYIEAFPGGMFRMLPEPSVPRRAQLFEIWIRPVVPDERPHGAPRRDPRAREARRRRALRERFQTTRDYLMKNVYLLTATQDHALGTALDQKWYGLPDYVTDMRAKLGKLTRADVNAALKRHLQAKNLSVVVVTKDAEGLKAALVGDALLARSRTTARSRRLSSTRTRSSGP